MVDERLNAPSAMRFTDADSGDWRPGPLTRVGEAVAALFSSDPDEPGRQFRLPVIVTGVWLMALGAYAVGYFDRLGAEAAAGASRALPTLDLLFFAFAAVGPVLMLWMVVLLQARSARLSDAMTAQSESALALAATVASLHEAVETLSAGTRDKISDAATVLERDGAAAIGRLDDALAELTEKLDTGLLNAVMLLDRNLRERTAKADASLDAQRDALARRLDDDAERLASRLDDDAERLARMVEAQARGVEAAQLALGERIAASLTAHGNRFESGTAALLETLGAQLDEIAGNVDAALSRLAADLSQAQRNRHRELDADMRQRETRMHDAVEALARTIEGEVAPALGELRHALAETGRTVAANPPASAEALARLLGQAASREIAPERTALTTAIARLTALEEEAHRLMERIDRTARLNPLMETAAAPGALAAAAADPELPFAALPRGAGRAALDWTAVIHALDGRRVGASGRRAVDAVRADPDVAAVAELAAGIAAALAEDGLHVSDLSPVHAPAALWHRFALGERGGELAALAGIEDEIALAIVGARLRDDAGFRGLALRLATAYARLLGRAATQMGADPRLVELAETPAGRAFVLIATLTRAFQPVPLAAE